MMVPVMGMVVYLDGVVLLNGILDYLLLMVCGRVTGSVLRRRRILLAALGGGVYAAMSLVPGMIFLGKLLWQMVFGALLCLCAFGPSRCLVRQTVVLYLLAAAFSGVVLVLTEVMEAPAALLGRRVYYPVTFGVLVLTGGGAFGVMQWCLGRLQLRGGDVAEVTVTLAGREVRFTALRDTGNTLRDPISGCPVLVADPEILRRLGLRLTDRELQFPAAALERLEREHPALRPRLIPYKALGRDQGMLLALRPEQVTVAGKRETLLLGCAPNPVSDGGGYQALLGGSI
jgi:stage II sporulation protein GA (sporulation sigma-E factor processing peptidase)